MLWLSLVAVFGTLGLIALGLTSEVPRLELGAGWLIGGRVPWLLLGLLWGGVAFGAVTLWRGRSLPRLGVVLLEVVPVVAVTWYVLAGVPGGAGALAIDVGDAFPTYALEDQDGAHH